MTRPLNLSEADILEELLDHCGLRALLEALSEICQGKFEHVQENWPEDVVLAYRWRFAADQFQCLASLRAYDL